MNPSLAKKLSNLPKKPGVYLHKDQDGAVLYVGKAVNLRNRVSSYFKKDAGTGSVRIQNMIAKIADLDFVVVDNELESLVLENNLIKQYRPKYNVLLRDDKNYLFIKINLKDEIPTIQYENFSLLRQYHSRNQAVFLLPHRQMPGRVFWQNLPGRLPELLHQKYH